MKTKIIKFIERLLRTKDDKEQDAIIEKYSESRFERDLKTLRAEMRKPKPDGEKIFKLLCGDKYTEPLIKKK